MVTGWHGALLRGGRRIRTLARNVTWDGQQTAHVHRLNALFDLITVQSGKEDCQSQARTTRPVHILPLTPETRFGTIQAHKMSGSLENFEVTRVFRQKALLRQVNGTISATPRAARS